MPPPHPVPWTAPNGWPVGREVLDAGMGTASTLDWQVCPCREMKWLCVQFDMCRPQLKVSLVMWHGAYLPNSTAGVAIISTTCARLGVPWCPSPVTSTP